MHLLLLLVVIAVLSAIFHLIGVALTLIPYAIALYLFCAVTNIHLWLIRFLTKK